MTETERPMGERPGEIALPFDPASRASDAGIVFIGRLRTPWTERRDCPRNKTESLARGDVATVEVDPDYVAGLAGLEGASEVVLLYWMHQARRDLIVQAPRHGSGTKGVFALRSPVRPNPIALAIADIVEIDVEKGWIKVRGLDCLDGTPLVDIKPFSAGLDRTRGPTS